MSVPGTSARSATPARTASVPVPSARPRPAGRPRHVLDGWVLALLLAIPGVVTVLHFHYYTLSRAERLRAPDHALLRPSSGIGLAFGVAALALFLFMWLYPLRKHARWLAWTGSTGAWLRIHVIAGLVLPFVGAVHAGWRFEGLIGLGYLSMLIVSLSGIVGRYLYAHIPRSRSGLELSRDEVAAERRALITRIAAATGLEPAEVERALAVDPRPYAGLDPLRTVARMIRDDHARGRALRRLRREWSRGGVGARRLDARALRETMRLARREMSLAQQARLLAATQRIFGWWHVAHRPFALTAFAAVIVHVLVAIVVGGVGLPRG